jgi:hypothetical protein
VTQASRLVADLQDGIMTSRMVPVWQVFDRFPRVVRDAARALGKQVEFVVEGRRSSSIARCSTRSAIRWCHCSGTPSTRPRDAGACARRLESHRRAVFTDRRARDRQRS